MLHARALRRLGRSRLVHFAALGGVLFALAPPEEDPRELTIDAPRVALALRSEEARAGRALDRSEKEAAIAALVDEELLAREALRLGVGAEDPVVRARLSEAMRAALVRTLPDVGVDDEELTREIARRLERAPERVRLGVRLFRRATSEATGAAARAPDGAAGDTGDRPPIPDGAWWTEEALARAAGAAVADAAMRTEVGRPSAPTASAWGTWIVVPLERRRPDASEVRAEAYAELRGRKQADALAKLLERRRRDYRVDVRAPEGEGPLLSRGSE
ncbi:MAG: hypothetical protein KF782_31950 [Labilithrix sp.]|nr:hypothetical protein [Labilithrix sp.]